MRGGRFLIRPHGLDDDVVRAFQGERGKFREDRGLRTRISSSAGIPRPSRDVRRVLAWVISSVSVDFPFISAVLPGIPEQPLSDDPGSSRPRRFRRRRRAGYIAMRGHLLFLARVLENKRRSVARVGCAMRGPSRHSRNRHRSSSAEGGMLPRIASADTQCVRDNGDVCYPCG